MPTLCGDGDLDGDDYFVLWEKKILRHLQNIEKWEQSQVNSALNLLEVKEMANEDAQPPPDSSSTWLRDAQEQMLNFERLRGSNLLTGKLFSLSRKLAMESADGMYHEDACAVAQAYKDSLDIRKHGGNVPLSLHLHKKLPQSSQQFLDEPKEIFI